MIENNEENKIYKADLTKKEKDLLAYIEEKWYETGGYTPTYREICSAVNISTTSLVYKMMNKLEKQGYIKKINREQKGVRKNTKRYELLGSKLNLNEAAKAFYKNEEDEYDIPSINVAKIPLFKEVIKVSETFPLDENDLDSNIKEFIVNEQNLKEYLGFPVEYGKRKNMIAFMNQLSKFKNSGMNKKDYIVIDMKEKYIHRDFVAKYNLEFKRLEIDRYERGEKNHYILGKVIGSYKNITY